MDQDRLNKFQSILSLQNEKYKEKLDRVAYASEIKKQIEAEQKAHDDKIIQMIQKERENDQKLQKV